MNVDSAWFGVLILAMIIYGVINLLVAALGYGDHESDRKELYLWHFLFPGYFLGRLAYVVLNVRIK